MNWKNILLIIILLGFSAGLVKTLGTINQGKKRLAEVKDEVAQTVRQKADVEAQIKERESLLYLETEARNRLNLVKPGERIVIMPKKPESAGLDGRVDNADATNLTNEPNWIKWKRLFFP